MFGRIPGIGVNRCWVVVGAVVFAVAVVGCSGVGVELLMLVQSGV